MEAQDILKVVKQKTTKTSSHCLSHGKSVIQLILNKSQCFNQSLSLLTTILDETDELIGCNPDRLAKPVFITGHHKQQRSRRLPEVYYPATDLQLSLSSSKLTIDLPSKQKPWVTGPQSRPHHWRKSHWTISSQTDQSTGEKSAARRRTHSQKIHFYTLRNKDWGIVISWPWNSPAFGWKVNGKRRRHPRRRCVFSKNSNMSVWSQGGYSCGLGLFLSWKSGQSRLLCGPVSLPVCLGDSINTSSHKAPSNCVFVSECVCCACVCVICATPCLKSTVQPISPLHIKASIIHPTTLFIISRHFLLFSPVAVFAQKSSYSTIAVFNMLYLLQ